MSISSTITAVPTGPVDWCLFPDWRPPNLLPGLNGPPRCGNGQPGKTDVDYGTNTRLDMFVNGTRDKIDLADLVCCRNQGLRPLEGLPLAPWGQRTKCLTGTPTPLLSLAATNTGDWIEYSVTYPGVSYPGVTYPGVTFEGLSYSTLGTSQVLVGTGTPYCLWFNIVSVSSMKDVTVQALQVTPTANVSSGTLTTGVGTGTAMIQTAGGTNGSKSTSLASRLKPRMPDFYLWTMLCGFVLHLYQ